MTLEEELGAEPCEWCGYHVGSRAGLEAACWRRGK